jgi:hypothetical protein
MSAKTLAPIALGIGALYLLSSKGSPFSQQQQQDAGKPGGEHVGPPEPETDTPNSKAQDAKTLKRRDTDLHNLAGLTGETKNSKSPVQKAITKVEKRIAANRPPLAPAKPTSEATHDPKAVAKQKPGFTKKQPHDFLSSQT